MFAGASPSFWIAFHAIVLVLLLIDLLVLGRFKRQTVAAAWGWTAVVAAIAFAFALLVSHRQGSQRALEFVSGYLVEGSLSVDNLFVFLLLFRSLKLPVEEQRRVLMWGVLGAIGMRAIFIFAGVALLERFAWLEYVFAAVLIYAGVRLLKPKHGAEKPPAPVEWLRRRFSNGGGAATSAFLLTVLVVEGTDLIFALDSIPAVLAITRDAFIVYTSNIFAILGLRSLYFAMSGLLDQLRLLHYGLACILIFVGLKMVSAKWVAIPAPVSLAVILLLLGTFTVASKLMPAPAHE
jgi:tellurite resistance protein TerC